MRRGPHIPLVAIREWPVRMERRRGRGGLIARDSALHRPLHFSNARHLDGARDSRETPKLGPQILEACVAGRPPSGARECAARWSLSTGESRERFAAIVRFRAFREPSL